MLIHVDGHSHTPVFQQIVGQVKAAVARGACRPGEMIPSVRQMAAQALVNPNTVAKAYRELEREGILTTRRGLGVFVAESAPQNCQEERRTALRRRLTEVVAEAKRAGVTTAELRQLLTEVLKEAVESGGTEK